MFENFVIAKSSFIFNLRFKIAIFMRIRLLLLPAAFLILGAINSFAQIVGGNVFLQGQWLEVGVDNMAAFGTCSSPVGYHAHPACGCTGTCTTAASAMDASYDWGHDGWATGTPCLMGPYTQPGYPQEGWGIQVGATEYRNWAGGGLCSGSFNIPGSITGYTNTGGSAIGTFTGTVAGLNIVQDTRVDTLASWVVVTCRIYNTTLAPITGVFYERTCDPDNSSDWGGGSTTENVIIHQNEDWRHDVEIGTYANSGIFNMTNSWMALGTRDCRAKCGTLSSLYPFNTPSQLWSGTGAVITALNDSNYNDVGIFLVFNIGNIAGNDSAVVSYAYIYDGRSGFDSAFPNPILAFNGVAQYNSPDTLDGCSYPGVDSLPVNILYGADKDWTWGSWTWSPSTGLSSTTGVNNYIHLNMIPGDITYTVIGTDSASGAYDCLNDTLIFTVHSCHQAYANSPCEGGALHLGMLGDSVGATYFWWGPSGFASYLHDPIIFPATMADTGTYYVVRTIGGINDTDNIHVIIHPSPIVTATSNIALCGPLVSPLLLNASLDSIGETFSWTGPAGFTSTLQSPTISPFDSSLQGTYAVTGTSVWGCTASATIDIYAVSVPYFTYSINRGCATDTVYFNDLTFNASYYVWSFGDGDTTIGRNAEHFYVPTSSQVFTVSLTTSNAHCPNTTWDTLVDTRHIVQSSFWPTPDTFCLGTPSVMVNNSITTLGPDTGNVSCNCYTVSSYWDYGNGATDTVNNPTYTYDACGAFDVHLTVTDSLGCTSTSAQMVYVIQLGVTSFTDTTLCISMPLPMSNVVTVCPVGFSAPKQFVWTQNTPNLSDTSIQNPTLSGLGLFVDTLTISYPAIPGPGGTFGCAIRDTVTVDAVMGRVLTDVTASATIEFGGSILLNANNEIVYYWKPDDGSLSNPNINDPIATPSVTTTYTVYGLDTNGCLDSAYVTVYVDTSTETGLPSAFTPNGDHVNDVFHLVGSKYDKLVEMRVFNRWGECVYMTNDRTQGWDGTYKGVPQDMGVYNYSIIIATPGGENIVYKGNITLIR